MRVKKFDIESKFKRGFKKGNMHAIIIIELTTIVSSIIVFELKLVPMFLHMDSIREIKNSLQSWSLATISFIMVVVKGVMRSQVPSWSQVGTKSLKLRN
jgi:hypothetical protein